MTAPLDGVQVLEVANWLAAPSAAALMCDLGADVIKVEPPSGDVFRHFDLASINPHDYDLNYAFELDNRGKRSIVVSLDRPGGPELVRRLAAEADVFVTNLTPPRRQRYGLDDSAIRAVNPRTIYASLTGYGTRGPDAARAGFDYSAFWARSGIMGALAQPSSPPPLNRGGQGDHTTALNLLAAILAALLLRERTGEGQYVEVTLQASGMWTIGADLVAAAVSGKQPPRHDRTNPPNPIWNSYQTRDERWLLLVMPQPEPYWGAFCEAISETDWTHDARYDSLAARREHAAELTSAIERRFAQEDLAYWSKRLDQFGLIWAPAADLPEVLADPQVEAMGLLTTVEHPEAGPYQTLNTPFEVRGASIGPRGPAPALGADTESILAELGLSTVEVAELAANGVLG